MDFFAAKEWKESLELEKRSVRLKAFRRKARLESICYPRISTAAAVIHIRKSEDNSEVQSFLGMAQCRKL
ncbi:hypothetical protein [Paenibacillus graminis]|uniref:hypothetical protein n=1 Tax=Paenibacillus graminis TaxID=189425 RepID=UPI0012DC0571|nr:hypothetical protein [Paenibacillus graminis]